jgi:hypothetical protein
MATKKKTLLHEHASTHAHGTMWTDIFPQPVPLPNTIVVLPSMSLFSELETIIKESTTQAESS